jgi:putative transposase
MVRQARLDTPGVLHHVMARGIERRPIFIDDRDRDEFVRRLSDLALEGKLIIYAWSLMPNHFHLLVRTGKISLSRSMRSLLTGYAGYFNRRHRRHGHVFQNRFKSIICEEEPYFLELVRYLHLNPLRAGVVKDLKGLDRYPYTGHSVLAGRIDRSWQDTEDVWSRFGGTCREAAKSYRAFVSDGVGQGRRPDLMGGGLYRSMGGWHAVVDLRRGREAYRSDERVWHAETASKEWQKVKPFPHLILHHNSLPYSERIRIDCVSETNHNLSGC